MNNNESYKQIVFWAAIIIGIGLVVAGMIWLVSLQANKPTDGSVTIENTIAPDDWVKGNRNAEVILIEYSDFQCPACAYYSPLVNTLSDEFGDRLAFVYRHFPLPKHQNSKPMVYAAEAAGMQEKFWEMHGLIFDGQTKWADEKDVKNIIVGYAESLGLNVEQFVKDLDSVELKKRMDETFQKNDRIGITYTPTFFLNGKRISNPKSYAEFKDIIAKAINENPEKP
ncbi:MAG: thioredoxin domain-containing protein [Patescibacteria group bacterium]